MKIHQVIAVNEHGNVLWVLGDFVNKDKALLRLRQLSQTRIQLLKQHGKMVNVFNEAFRRHPMGDSKFPLYGQNHKIKYINYVVEV